MVVRLLVRNTKRDKHGAQHSTLNDTGSDEDRLAQHLGGLLNFCRDCTDKHVPQTVAADPSWPCALISDL
jgi:hypothetical protein